MAADVITRFRLETAQYDSALRDSSKALAAYAKQTESAGKDFTNFSQNAINAAKSLGQVVSGATNTKDKLRDLVGAYNDVAKTYNKLSEVQRQTDFGKNMAASLEQLQVRIKETKQELYGLGDAVKGGGGGLFGGGKLDGMLQVFGGNLMTKAAGMAAGLASEIGDAVKQGIELAKQGEGIRIAFERLGRGDILDGLREATHGTVTDLELMKAAVKFNDFKLPVEELGTMLAFAQQKAKDTGQSVDYMVDSIVTGLGRKSLMILDNLGLSATEVKEKMKETGDMTKAVGEIIREQMAKAGDYVETAADRAAQANVSLQNKMEELGRKFAPVEEASSQLWTSMKIGILDIIGGPLATLLNQLTEAGRLKNMLNSMNGDAGSGNTKVDQQLKKLNVIKKAGGSDYYFQSTLSGMVEDYNRQIMALDAQIKNGGKKPGAGSGESQDVRYLQQKMDALKIMRDQLEAGAKELSKPVDVKIDTKGAEQNVESLKMKLIELQAQRKKAIAAGDTDLSKSLLKQINQVKADIKGLGGTTSSSTSNKTQSTRDSIESQWLNAKAKTDFMVQQDLMPTGPNKNSGYDMMREYIEKNILGVKDWDYKKDISEKDYKKLPGYKEEKEKDKTVVGEMQKLTGGVQGIFSGIEQMGVEIPEELKGIMSGISGVMTILTSINTILGVIKGLQAVGVLPFFARGGVVPHAAGGYMVPGTHYSGDVTPILANAGEVVLNRAQTAGLAQELEGVGSRQVNVHGVLRGKDIFIAAENWSRSAGRGEFVTW